VRLSATLSAQPPDGPPHRGAPPSLVQWLWRDRLVLIACVFCGLLIAFQALVALFHPPWDDAVSDRIGVVLAWPALLVVLYVSVQLSRGNWPGAFAWWMWGAALFSFAVGHTVSIEYDPLNFTRTGPFPILPSFFYLLQYPFFFLAVILLPHTRQWGSRFILIVDGLLLMGGATALSWYFILQPMTAASGWSTLERAISLAFPIGDLAVLFGLTLILLRPSRYEADRLVLSILVVATACLFVADFWAAWHLLNSSQPYTTGNPSDVFWLPFHLLVPLAALVQLRLMRHAPVAHGMLAITEQNGQPPERQDLVASLRLFLPILVALLASVAILIHASMTAMRFGWQSVAIAFVVCFDLLLLIIVRQGTMYLENVRLRHESEVARAQELALRELDQRKDVFLNIVSHELKTPLTSLQGYMQLLVRRFAAPRPHKAEDDDFVRTAIRHSEESVLRMARLVDDLMDDASVRDGQLTLHLEPYELGTLVRAAVEEQQVLHPDRLIQLSLPSDPAQVLADVMRVRQVITNYLMNALKYSREDQPVDVRLVVEAEVARVEVRDRGPGVPVSEQAHVWEHYYRVEGVDVQSGSRIGLGLGLYISKYLIEAHHGQVGVDSAPRQGATFWFTLPLIHSESG
jgi:signal transduction histidine kinase